MGDRVVCGYLIVRRPEANFDEARKTVSEHQPSVPNINGKYYSGVDRMPWADITEKYYARALPEQLEKTWEEVQRFNGAYQDICITPDIQWAIQLLEYSNREGSRNELLAIYSPALEKIKGVCPAVSNILWLGIDIDCPGFGSQIVQGIFKVPKVFPEFLDLLNSKGLFEEDGPIIDQYIQAYFEREQEANLEPMSDVAMNIDRVHVWRVEV